MYSAFSIPFFLLINVSGYRQIIPGKPGCLTPTARLTPATGSGSAFVSCSQTCDYFRITVVLTFVLLQLYRWLSFVASYVAANDSKWEALSKIKPNGSSRTKKWYARITCGSKNVTLASHGRECVWRDPSRVAWCREWWCRENNRRKRRGWVQLALFPVFSSASQVQFASCNILSPLEKEECRPWQPSLPWLESFINTTTGPKEAHIEEQ
jgi:hypothetical protein